MQRGQESPSSGSASFTTLLDGGSHLPHPFSPTLTGVSSLSTMDTMSIFGILACIEA